MSASFESLDVPLTEGYDRAYIEASRDGQTWELIQQPLGDTNRDWLSWNVPLYGFAGEYVQFRFTFDTGNEWGNDFEGWYIDALDIVNYQVQATGLWHQTQAVPTGLTEDADGNGTCYYYGAEPQKNYDIDDQTGSEGSGNSGSLILPSFTVPQNSVLTFYNWLQTEQVQPSSIFSLQALQVQHDTAQVFIRPSGDVDWTLLGSLSDYDTGWQSHGYWIDGYEGQVVEIKFEFDTVNNQDNDFEGWYIDFLQIECGGGE